MKNNKTICEKGSFIDDVFGEELEYVKIYDGNLPKGVSKPSGIKINSDSPNKGWDPTDPDKKNPWR